MYKQSAISKRFLAMLLSLVLLLSNVPFSVHAGTVNEDGYIEIRTIEDLYNIRNDMTANYILMNDIDLTEATAEGGDWDYGGRGWNPIGSNDIYGNEAFSGIFDGNGYTIKGMRVSFKSSISGMNSNAYVGLFANVTGEIRNLTMSDTRIDNAYASGYLYAGAVAGYNSGSITNCSVSGIVTPEGCGTYVGGIVGYNKGTINKTYNTATVDGYKYAGGIAGYNTNSIENCYNTGTVTVPIGDSYSYRYSGGISGYNYGVSAVISNCYNTGTIVDNGSYYSDNCAIAYTSGTSIINSYYLTGSGSMSSGSTALTDTQMRLKESFAGFDFGEIWELNTFANHPYPQLKNNIQDMNETVTLIRLIAYPAKMEYLTGDELNTIGGMFEAIYISGKTELIALSAEHISGYNPEKTGRQTLTVTYGGQTDTFAITVTKRPVATSIKLLTEPTVSEFVVGTELDFSGATIQVEYDNGTFKEMDVTAEMTTGANINHMGTQTVTISIDGCIATFKIKIIPASIVGISIQTVPTKIVYNQGEALDTTGLTIVANYSNGSQIAIASGYTISGYNSKKLGTQTVTVDFAGKTASFTVTVKERELVNIEIRNKPGKLNYVAGDTLDLTGMLVVAVYETGDAEIINDYTVSGFDSTAGVKVVTVSYKGKRASFTVTVAVLAVEKLTITKMPTKVNYIENEPLDTEGLSVTATYNNGTVDTVTDYEVVGFSTQPGTHTIYVTFGGQTASFQINVSAKVLCDVRIVLPHKTTYFIGEAFDVTGMEVIACYNNGQEIAVEDYQISGFNSNIPGAQNVTITYDGIVRSFAVVVQERTAIQTGGGFAVQNAIGRLGEEVRVPVKVTGNTGIAGFRQEISFNVSNLKFVGAELLGDYKNGTLIANQDKASQGQITVVWFCDNDVKSNGAVYELIFEVRETAVDGFTDVKLAFTDNCIANTSGENVIFGKQDGGVEVRSYWLGDLNGDRKFAMVDLVMLAQYVAGYELSFTAKQLLSADVNEDGIIDIHDIVLLNQWLLAEDF